MEAAHITGTLRSFLMGPVIRCWDQGNWHSRGPSNNGEVMGADPRCRQKSKCNSGLTQNLTTNSLLLTGSLTNNINSRLTHILYFLCIFCCILTMKYAREKKLVEKIIRGKYMYGTPCFKNTHITKHTHTHTHLPWSKPTFQGHLYLPAIEAQTPFQDLRCNWE